MDRVCGLVDVMCVGREKQNTHHELEWHISQVVFSSAISRYGRIAHSISFPFVTHQNLVMFLVMI